MAQSTGTWDDRLRLNPVLLTDGTTNVSFERTPAYRALSSDGDVLFLGGTFEKVHRFDLPRDAPEAPVNPADFNSIGWFDGTVWRQMDYGLRSNRDPRSIYDLDPGTVKDILVDGDDVYVAGNFYAWELDNGQFVTQNNIARWSRTDNQWHGLHFGLASRKERRGSRYNGDVSELRTTDGGRRP